MKNSKKGLKKSIGFTAAFSTVVGTVIGTGVFFKTSAVTQYTGSASLAMFAWFLAGLITICAGLTVIELAAMFPKTGGLTRYISHSYGKFWGFLAGWAQAIVYFPANVAAMSIAFGTQVANLFDLNISAIIPIAFLCACLVFGVNFISIKVAGRVTTVALVFKLIPLVAIIILGFFHQGSGTISFFPISTTADHPFWTSLGQGLLAIMFAYDGWIHVGNIAGEMKNPKRDLPIAISAGIGLIMVIYLLFNAVSYWILPVSDIAGNMNVAADVAKVIFGDIGGKIITIGILISVFGGVNGYVMTGMRIPYYMGQRDELPFSSRFKKLNDAGVPFFAGLVQLVIAGIMMLSGQFDAITNMLTFVIWLFYTLAFVAVIKLRRTDAEVERPYKVPGYPIIPAVAILGGLFILITTLITQFQITAIGLVITLVGVPIYFYMQRKKN
ncbi:amino acid permease [Lactobacillus sp. YT155]|uniref:APC family permease n=1 Tax=Lactobacillus sp. YT155 TaxID=3060955 RepID=UPI00265FAD95|nr:amino acid permease [Lactobacillus sp. YT155]MDO1605418.1 amino acid permease [Lactobacillus sp. YT155]